MRKIEPDNKQKKEHPGSLKKREWCKGGKPHDWALVYPEYIEVKDGFPYDPVAYYHLLQKERKFLAEMDPEYEKIGVKTRWMRRSDFTFVNFVCTECGKKKWGNEKDFLAYKITLGLE